MKKLKYAVFLGQDSCGFKNNHMYLIEIERDSRWKYTVKDQNSPAICPYEDMRAIYKNWYIIGGVI